jgi:peroxiredoxin Q/BCP
MKSTTPLALAALFVALIAPALPARAGDMLGTGDAFPAWSLKDHTGAQRSSSELAGKTYLLWFFPKAMTPGCTAEGRGLRDVNVELAAAGVSVFGISADAPADNAAFVAAEHFPFVLLSDEKLTLANAVGATNETLPGRTRRISYLVGADGKVRKAYADVDPATHAQQVLRDASEAPAAPPQH